MSFPSAAEHRRQTLIHPAGNAEKAAVRCHQNFCGCAVGSGRRKRKGPFARGAGRVRGRRGAARGKAYEIRRAESPMLARRDHAVRHTAAPASPGLPASRFPTASNRTPASRPTSSDVPRRDGHGSSELGGRADIRGQPRPRTLDCRGAGFTDVDLARCRRSATPGVLAIDHDARPQAALSIARADVFTNNATMLPGSRCLCQVCFRRQPAGALRSLSPFLFREPAGQPPPDLDAARSHRAADFEREKLPGRALSTAWSTGSKLAPAHLRASRVRAPPPPIAAA